MAETKQKNTWETIVLIILVVAIAIDYYVLIQHQIKIKELERARIMAQRSMKTMYVLEERYCKGVWKDNQCVTAACVDSDADAEDPLAVAGQVSYADEEGNAQTIVDACTEDGTSVTEQACIMNEDGSASPSEEESVCTDGCVDGACVVKEAAAE